MKIIFKFNNYILKFDFYPSSTSQMTFHVIEIKEHEKNLTCLLTAKVYLISFTPAFLQESRKLLPA